MSPMVSVALPAPAVAPAVVDGVAVVPVAAAVVVVPPLAAWVVVVVVAAGLLPQAVNASANAAIPVKSRVRVI